MQKVSIDKACVLKNKTKVLTKEKTENFLYH